jgi:predicted metal-dependent enzyme (double-stranded beta helix superfamily)
MTGGGSVASPSYLSLDAFVGETTRLIDGEAAPREVHRFLSGTLIEPASLDRRVRFEPGRYTRHLVHKSPAVEILVLCWAQGSKAPIHGHEGELCWARVERGILRFTSYREVSRSPLGLRPLGAPVDGHPGHLDGPADIHSVENPGEVGRDAVSLHVYSRPYDECDIYDLEQGVIRRVSLGYDSMP